MGQVTLSEEEFAYFKCLGHALSDWADVEDSLLALVLMFFPLDQSRPRLAMGFVDLETFNAKVKFADGVITRGLAGSPHQDAWAKLAAKLRKRSQKRNRLAHNKTDCFATNTPGQRWALIPWSAPKGRDKTKPPPESLCVLDIYRAGMQFNALNAEIQNFAHRIAGQKEPYQESQLQVTDLPTVQQLVLQMREELGDPHLSLREKRRLEDAANAAASLENTHVKTASQESAPSDSGGSTAEDALGPADTPQICREEEGKKAG